MIQQVALSMSSHYEPIKTTWLNDQQKVDLTDHDAMDELQRKEATFESPQPVLRAAMIASSEQSRSSTVHHTKTRIVKIWTNHSVPTATSLVTQKKTAGIRIHQNILETMVLVVINKSEITRS